MQRTPITHPFPENANWIGVQQCYRGRWGGSGPPPPLGVTGCHCRLQNYHLHNSGWWATPRWVPLPTPTERSQSLPISFLFWANWIGTIQRPRLTGFRSRNLERCFVGPTLHHHSCGFWRLTEMASLGWMMQTTHVRGMIRKIHF